MRPFSSLSKTSLPAWTFRSGGDETSLRLSLGPWFLTDGACWRDAIEIGTVTEGPASLCLRRDLEGLSVLELVFSTGAPVLEDGHEFVINSGLVVLCSQDAFKREGIDDRVAAALLRSSQRAHSDTDVVLIEGVDQECVGITAAPPFGDGAYWMHIDRSGEFCRMRIDLGASR